MSELYPENINAIPDIVHSLLIENTKETIPVTNTTFQITNITKKTIPVTNTTFQITNTLQCGFSLFYCETICVANLPAF